MRKNLDLAILFVIFLCLFAGTWIDLDLLKIILGIYISFFLPGYLLLRILNQQQKTGEEFIFAVPGIAFVLVSILMTSVTYILSAKSLTYWVSYGLFICVLAISLILQRRKKTFEVGQNGAANFIQLFTKYRFELTGLIILLIGFGFVFLQSDRNKPQYTEFFLINNEGFAGDFVQTFERNALNRSIVIGTTNKENQAVTYNLYYLIDGQEKQEISQFRLENGQTNRTSFVPPQSIVGKHKISFYLYKNDSQQVYRSSYIWVDIK